MHDRSPIAKRRPLPLGVLVAALAGLLLGGCAHFKAAHPPNQLLEDAHSGGTVVAFDAAGSLLASAGWGGKVRLWRLPDGAAAGAWQAHKGSVNGLAFVDDGLVSAGYDATLAHWAADGHELRRVAAGSPVTAMALGAGQGMLVTGHSDGTVRRWRLPGLELTAEWHPHQGAVRALAVAIDGHTFASGGADGRVFLWLAGGGPEPLPAPPTDPWSLAFAPDGARLFAGGWFKLSRWDLATRTLTVLDTDHTGILKGLHFTADGRYLASISRQTDSSVYFLDPETGATVERFQRHRLCGADVTVSADGHYLASTSDDGTVRLWALQRLRPTTFP
jgi:WD40 repeat protein